MGSMRVGIGVAAMALALPGWTAADMPATGAASYFICTVTAAKGDDAFVFPEVEGARYLLPGVTECDGWSIATHCS